MTIDQSQVLMLPERCAGHGPGLVQVPLLQGPGRQGAERSAQVVWTESPSRADGDCTRLHCRLSLHGPPSPPPAHRGPGRGPADRNDIQGLSDRRSDSRIKLLDLIVSSFNAKYTDRL